MSFCPKCKFEYEDHMVKCPDCGIWLIAQQPAPEDTTADDGREWIQLARLNTHQYAHMVEQAIKDQGIPVVLHSETGHFGETGQMGLLYRAIGGGFSILVPRSHVLEADTIAAGILGDEWAACRLVDIEVDDDPPEPPAAD